jgi:hypothetical protein
MRFNTAVSTAYTVHQMRQTDNFLCLFMCGSFNNDVGISEHDRINE